MAKYEFPVIIEKDEDGMLIASVPSLKGCHTQAKTIPTLLKRIREAILLYLEVAGGVSNEFPSPKRGIWMRSIIVNLREILAYSRSPFSPEGTSG